MKNIRISCLLLILFISLEGCNSRYETSSSSINIGDKSKSNNTQEITVSESIFRNYTFATSKNNPQEIGYLKVPDGEDIGIKSVALWGEWAILSDTYFNSLKKINLLTGELKSGLPLVNSTVLESGIWLGEITVFNEKIYACSLDSIISFDKDLNKINSYKLPRGNKYIWKKNLDSLQIYIDHKQYENTDIGIDIFFITTSGENGFKEERMKIEDYTKRTLSPYSEGRPFYVQKSGNNYLFSPSSSRHIALKSELTQVDTYDAFNLSFSESHLVYFSSKEGEFRLFCYSF